MLIHNLIACYIKHRLNTDQRMPVRVQDYAHIRVRGVQLLKYNAAPLDAKLTPICCLHCLRAKLPTTLQLYGKLLPYCSYCYQKDKTLNHNQTMDFYNLLLNSYADFYPVYELEAVICKVIEERLWNLV